jgi:ectoine hydroxylase-related dioxygenase (phytanoyl-CoA dioxygenase family)
MVYNPSQNPESITNLYRYDQLATHRLASIDDITDETVRNYTELGYVAIEQVLSAEEVAAACQEINDVIHGKIVGPRVQYFRNHKDTETSWEFESPEQREWAVRKLHKFIDYCPSLNAICYHPKILAALEKMFGEAPRFWGIRLFF